jgi:hypothetical protein
MNSESRIPELNAVSFDGALQWFAEMQCRGLFFTRMTIRRTLL